MLKVRSQPSAAREDLLSAPLQLYILMPQKKFSFNVERVACFARASILLGANILQASFTIAMLFYDCEGLLMQRLG